MLLQNKRKREEETTFLENSDDRKRIKQDVSELVKSEYPVLSSAIKYSLDYDNLNIFNQHTKHNIPPEVLFQTPDYGLLTVDLICQYFTQDSTKVPSSSLSKSWDFFSRYTKSTMVAGLAAVMGNMVLERGLEMYLQNVQISLETESNIEQMQQYIPSIVPAALIGVIVSKLGIDYSKLYAKRDNLETLQKSCLNLYKTLCENHLNQTCPDSSPFECRKFYLKSVGESKMRNYLQIPLGIMKPFVTGRRNVEDIKQDLEVVFNEWKERILDTKGIAEEVGLILSIVFSLKKNIFFNKIVAEEVNSLLQNVYILDTSQIKQIYTRAIRSCYLVMLLSEDNDLMEFVKKCILPTEGRSKEKNGVSFLATEQRQTYIHEEIMQEIEKKIDVTISLDIRQWNPFSLPIQKSTILDETNNVSSFVPSIIDNAVYRDNIFIMSANVPEHEKDLVLYNYFVDKLKDILDNCSTICENYEEKMNIIHSNKLNIKLILQSLPNAAFSSYENITNILLPTLLCQIKEDENLINLTFTEFMRTLTEEIYDILLNQVALYYYGTTSTISFYEYIERYNILIKKLQEILYPFTNEEISERLKTRLSSEIRNIKYTGLIPQNSREDDELLKRNFLLDKLN